MIGLHFTESGKVRTNCWRQLIN